MVVSRSARFVIVGVGVMLLFFGLNWLFVAFGAPPFASGIAAYAIAFLCAYGAHHKWTFEGARAHSQVFPRYLAAQAFCAVISGIVSHVSVTTFGVAPAIMSAAATSIGSVVSYFLARHWVFADHRSSR